MSTKSKFFLPNLYCLLILTLPFKSDFHLVELRNPDNIPADKNGVQISHGGGVVLEKWLDRRVKTCRVPLEGVWAAAKNNSDPGPNWTTYQFTIINSYGKCSFIISWWPTILKIFYLHLNLDTYEDAEKRWAFNWINRDVGCPIYVVHST